MPTTTKTEGWCITRDYLAEEFDEGKGRVGYGQTCPEEVLHDFDQIINRTITVETDLTAGQIKDAVHWRAQDEDGERHYGGVVSMEWLMGADDLAYQIQQFCMTDSGATELLFRANDLPHDFVERHRKCGAIVKTGKQEWVLVYG
jgi:hypothetical protein